MSDTKMNAVLLTGHGGPEKLVYTQVDRPIPSGDQVLIRIAAAGVNNTDLNSRTGWYGATSNFSQLLSDTNCKETSESKELGGGTGGVLWGQSSPDAESKKGLQFPLIQGVDVCGTVVQAGPSADKELVGKRVICDIWVRPEQENGEDYQCLGTEFNGGFAEYLVMTQRSVHVMDSSPLTDIQLAAIPCAYGTAEHMLHKTRVAKGDTVLIFGASGGVGVALIQLVKIRGAKIISIVGNEEKAERAKSYGSDFAYLRSDPELEEKLTKDHHVTACMDPVCGDFFGMALRVLTIHGRYASCGAISNPMVNCDARNIIYKDLELHGATRYPPVVFQNLVGYIEKNLIKPPIAKTFPLNQIGNAQQFFQSKKFFGKVVLIP